MKAQQASRPTAFTSKNFESHLDATAANQNQNKMDEEMDE